MKASGIYIHIPFCTEKCIYCDFYSITNYESEIENFTENLCKEIELFKQNQSTDWNIDTIFIGGGTPSLLTSNQFEKIINQINKNFNLSLLKEFTIEANPGEFDIEKMKSFKTLGINRISFGFQSLDDNILKKISRWHTYQDCIKSYNNARKVGYENISIDMLFGIPDQDIKQWEKEINHIIELEPEHISAYSLTVEKNTPLYTKVKSKKMFMPNEKTDIDMYKYAMNNLNQGKYLQYEISNYSKKNKECRHNLHYWNRDSYISFGPSAHGFYNNTRYWNYRDLNKYIKKINTNTLPIEDTEVLNNENIFNEIILNGLRMTKGINLNNIKNNFSKETFNLLSKKLIDWGNHINTSRNRIQLTQKGKLIADEITLDLISSYI